ncbi:MAG TPA: prepilin-type cleavage/methylation domain-containing protein [Comamonadaceae bacterium]|uniref:PilW family protein n=1 Tax=Pulveribacter sp. TaxID=2678893 RepID=UPI000ED7F547|nr:PilW family protein [Pulveribacter sp.]HCL86320.1 prepilin-type cleavage/methylation domain-containing protein [Comamonadaceae bacterium]
MNSKTIAVPTFQIRLEGTNAFNTPLRQRGVTLLELMVGLTIGLLTIAVAMGALMVSRGVSGTVSDASDLQQQAAYVYRVIGQQLRQAGSVKLELDAKNQDPNRDATLVQTLDRYKVIDVAAPVAFETNATATNPVPAATDALSGTATSVVVGFRNYKEPSFAEPAKGMRFSNCLGENKGNALVTSNFTLNAVTSELRCLGDNPPAQPVARNVANFQVRYLVQTGTATGIPRLQYSNTVPATDWGRVQGVEVCLVLYGSEPIDLPPGTSYTDCDGTTTVDMTALTGTRARRMHMVFRNVYQLRSQGLI